MARSSLMPGFRFHPTDVELVMYYLKNKLLGKKIIFNAVAEVNIYDFCPWDLPDKSSIKSGDLEWYFFCHKSKKYSSGGRTNRATKSGYWKATGKDRKVKFNERNVATIKTLVFYLGHAGKGGQRTDWVMHEYRMDDEKLASEGIVQDTYVLCKVFQKSGSGPKNGAQYGAPFNEEEWDDDMVSSLDPQAIFGPLGASITTDHKQKGPAITNMSEPGSSSVTFSENEHTNPLNYKQKGPATTDMTEPGSSVVTFSANEPTNVTEQGPTTMNMTEPGSSGVALPTTNEMPANNDVMFLADLDMIMGGLPEGAANLEKDKAMGPNEDDDIYGDLVNFWNLEDLEAHNNKTDEAEYILGELISPDDDDIGLGKFYVD